MPTNSTVVEQARTAFIRSMAPLGASRSDAALREGLPVSFRPALDFLFRGTLTPEDQKVVARVETLRADLADSTEQYYVYNFEQKRIPRTGKHISEFSSVTRLWGTFLYLCAKGFHADSILELGSCAGISGSYLTSVPSVREFYSVEMSDVLADRAQRTIRQILPSATVLNGGGDDILDHVLTLFARPIRVYYIDAFHEYSATLRFFEKGIPYLTPGALVVFDDIHWSKGMWQAWQQLRERQGFSHTVDVGRFGLCVWEGGTVKPKQYSFAKYAGWVWKYPPG